MKEEQYIIEHLTTSGFSLEITPFPPYYADIINDLYADKEYPRRVIELLAGDVITEEYEPTDDKPDEDDEDYHLWLRWHDVDDYNTKLGPKRSRAKRDMLLSLCISIINGPIDIEDSDWVIRLEAPFHGEYEVPENSGQRMLVFLKNIVLTHNDDADVVLQLAMFQEVSLQGVSHALHGFRSGMGRSSSDRDSVEGWTEEE